MRHTNEQPSVVRNGTDREIKSKANHQRLGTGRFRKMEMMEGFFCSLMETD